MSLESTNHATNRRHLVDPSRGIYLSKISLSHSRNNPVASDCRALRAAMSFGPWGGGRFNRISCDATSGLPLEIAAKNIIPSNSGGAPGPKWPVMAAAMVACGVVASNRSARLRLAQAETGPTLGSLSIRSSNPNQAIFDFVW